MAPADRRSSLPALSRGVVRARRRKGNGPDAHRP